MYNIYVRCNYKLILWFKSKVLNKTQKYKIVYKNLKLDKNMTYHNKDYRICKVLKNKVL